MKKFIIKLSVLLMLFVASVFFVTLLHIIIIGNQFEGSYQASLIDKVKRLQSIKEPKIVLIGNSNVNFGIDSSMIESELCMPVVDMGLHGGLGNSFHEEMVKLGVSKGDIVVVCHSSFADDDLIGDIELAWITIEFHPELWKLIRFKDIYYLIKGYPNYFFRSCINWICREKGNIAAQNTSYSRSAFNEHGDICYRNNNTFEFSEGRVSVPEINDTCINRLNELNLYIEAQGATMLVAGYPIGFGEFTPEPAKYDAFEKELRSKLDCEVISHYTDYFIPYDLFYDTFLHLSKAGARIRTQQLILDLMKWKVSRECK